MNSATASVYRFDDLNLGPRLCYVKPHCRQVQPDLRIYESSMNFAVVVPELGAGGLPLRISAWFVDPGDLVEAGDRLFEVLMAGITCDVAAKSAGRLSKIEKNLDSEVHPGETVAWIEIAPTDGISPDA
jgi:hypothetical protein